MRISRNKVAFQIVYSYFHALPFIISINDNNNTKCMTTRRWNLPFEAVNAGEKASRFNEGYALKNGDFSAISVTERNYVPPILKVESHTSDRSCATLWCNVDRYSHRNGNEWVRVRAATHWNGSKYLVASEDCNRPFRLTQRCTQLNLPGLRLFVYCICMIMRHSHSNDREIPETKRFIPIGFELGITLS